MARLRFGAHPDHIGPGPVGQGTVAPISQGTLMHPAPTSAPAQSGGTDETPNTQTVVNESSAWPRNIERNILPNVGMAAREFVLDTRFELQAQPPPGRILRQLWERVRGYTNASGDAVGTNGFPYNAEFAHIPHQPIPRNPMGPSPMLRSWDNNAPISAVYAGNPRNQ